MRNHSQAWENHKWESCTSRHGKVIQVYHTYDTVLMNVFFFLSSFQRIHNPILLDLRGKKVLIVLLHNFQFEYLRGCEIGSIAAFLKST
jgi:hypothetical protein